jgi:DNA-binding response OmpR family regulator
MKKVLIIEDDDFLRSLATGKLEKSGYAVSMAPNGKMGLAEIKATSPDLVILDLMLPEMSGFDVLESLRGDATTKNTRVVVFSNLGDPNDISRCTKLGVLDYLIKANFTLDELVEKVKTIIGA